MATKKSDSSSNKSVWLIGGIAALIAVAAIIAVASQSGSDEVVTGVEEFHPVEVVGEPLPEFSGEASDLKVSLAIKSSRVPARQRCSSFSPTGADFANAKYHYL